MRAEGHGGSVPTPARHNEYAVSKLAYLDIIMGVMVMDGDEAYFDAPPAIESRRLPKPAMAGSKENG